MSVNIIKSKADEFFNDRRKGNNLIDILNFMKVKTVTGVLLMSSLMTEPHIFFFRMILITYLAV